MPRFLTLFLMVAIAIAAFAVNPLMFSDRVESAQAVERSKTRASVVLPRPGHLQVIEARLSGVSPDEVTGRVVFRTIFGVPVGEHRYDGRTGVTQMRYWRWGFAWMTFLGAEAALGLYLFRRRDAWPLGE